MGQQPPGIVEHGDPRIVAGSFDPEYAHRSFQAAGSVRRSHQVGARGVAIDAAALEPGLATNAAMGDMTMRSDIELRPPDSGTRFFKELRVYAKCADTAGRAV